MNLQTIKTDEYYLLLDTDVKGYEHGRWFFEDGQIHRMDSNTDWTYTDSPKIIAQLPINVPPLQGVPLLPELPVFDVTGDDDTRPKPNYCFVEVTGGEKKHCVFPACHCGLASAAIPELPKEEDAEQLAAQFVYDYNNTMLKEGWDELRVGEVEQKWWEAGYKAATQQGRYSENHLVGLLQFCLQEDYFLEDGKYWINAFQNGTPFTPEEVVGKYLQSLNPIQGTEWVFEPEFEDCGTNDEGCLGKRVKETTEVFPVQGRQINISMGYKLKTTTVEERKIVSGKWIKK